MMAVPPVPLARGARKLCGLGLLVVLAGCAGNAAKEGVSPPDDYFAMSLPGSQAMMSPADNPVSDLSRLKNPPPLVIRRALLEQHESWSGTPYQLGGTSRQGVDCSALVQNVYRDTFDIALPRTTRGLVQKGREIKRQNLRAGDLVFFRPPGYRHVGIYVGDGYFLHASSSRGVIISALDNSYWRRYYWQSRRTLDGPTATRLSQVL